MGHSGPLLSKYLKKHLSLTARTFSRKPAVCPTAVRAPPPGHEPGVEALREHRRGGPGKLCKNGMRRKLGQERPGARPWVGD